MAHQAHNIPWNLLASNFQWNSGSSTCSCKTTNLHPRMKPTQGKEITYFIKAFVKNIKEHSKCERRKYPEHYEKPAPTDTIIDEATANLLTPTIRRVARNLDTVDRRTEGSWVPPDGSALLPEERQLAAFTRELKGSCYDFLPMYHDSFFNLQVIEALLLHGEMAPLLRVCAHSDAAFAIIEWLSAHACGCGVPQIGWLLVYEKALAAYICLNLLYCYPNMWDPASASAQSERMDYRSTKLYQNTLATCTEGGMTALVTYPHRHFFGTGDDDPKSGAFQVANNAHWLRWSHLTDKSGRSKQGLYGIVPIAEFLSLGKAASQPHDFNIMYQPSESDVSLVRGTLCKMGLPVELALDIMELAGYEPKKLKVEHDPLHPENREELAKYLKYCWQLLVRCDIIATEAGRQIKWYDAVAKCMINFLDSKDCKLRNQWFKIDYYEEWEFPYFFP